VRRVGHPRSEVAADVRGAMPVPRSRSAMRKIREVLRLTYGEGLSRHQVSAATGMPRTTVVECLARARAAGVTWPLPDGMDDRALELS
jgi:hypothetical protein